MRGPALGFVHYEMTLNSKNVEITQMPVNCNLFIVNHPYISRSMEVNLRNMVRGGTRDTRSNHRVFNNKQPTCKNGKGIKTLRCVVKVVNHTLALPVFFSAVP